MLALCIPCETSLLESWILIIHSHTPFSLYVNKLAPESPSSINLMVCPLGNLFPKTRIRVLVHSLRTTEPSDGFILSTLWLSVGLLHSLHRSSSFFLKSFRFIDASLASTQCTLVELSYRVFNNYVSFNFLQHFRTRVFNNSGVSSP
jgi:hypothetical protein